MQWEEIKERYVRTCKTKLVSWFCHVGLSLSFLRRV